MAFLCVSIFVESAEQAKRDIALAKQAGADIVELRIDRFTDAWDVADLLSDCTLPMIITCRPKWEGGEADIPDEERWELLRGVIKDFAHVVDVELKGWSCGDLSLAKEERDERPCFIVSSHDFTGRPAKLYNIIDELNRSPGDINKIVWTARTIRDNIEAFEILLNRQKPTIALCMGEAGLISRVLARKFGAFLTFASLTKDSATAPGQVTIADLKTLYRWDAITPETAVYGVVGSPIAHSMSPAIHNAAFAAVGHDGVYLPLLVNEGYESFKAFMESFLAFEPLTLRGLSVTIPHKENALRYLKEVGSEVEPLAERIGAVNTIVIPPGQGDRETRRQGEENGDVNSFRSLSSASVSIGAPSVAKLRGLNSDYAAILDSVTAALSITRDDLRGHSVAVIGAGGTGRTATAAFAHCGAAVTIYNRTVDRAAALAAEFTTPAAPVTAAPLADLPRSHARIFINTTSVGMHPRMDASPFDAGAPALSPDSVVFDCIYNPIETKLLRQARQAGAKTISGLEMFVRQAATQFEAWTAKPAPRDLMREVILKRLA